MDATCITISDSECDDDVEFVGCYHNVGPITVDLTESKKGSKTLLSSHSSRQNSPVLTTHNNNIPHEHQTQTQHPSPPPSPPQPTPRHFTHKIPQPRFPTYIPVDELRPYAQPRSYVAPNTSHPYVPPHPSRFPSDSYQEKTGLHPDRHTPKNERLGRKPTKRAPEQPNLQPEPELNRQPPDSNTINSNHSKDKLSESVDSSSKGNPARRQPIPNQPTTAPSPRSYQQEPEEQRHQTTHNSVAQNRKSDSSNPRQAKPTPTLEDQYHPQPPTSAQKPQAKPQQPSSHDMMITLKEQGNKKFRSNNLNEAVRLYREAGELARKLGNDDMLAILHFNLAMSYDKLGSYNQAADECAAAVKINDKYMKAHCKRAEIYMSQGKFDEAVICYEHICEIDSSKREDAHRRINYAKELAKTTRKRDQYEILGLRPYFTPEELKTAYKQKARAHHPDRHSDADIVTRRIQEKIFKEASEANAYFRKRFNYN